MEGIKESNDKLVYEIDWKFVKDIAMRMAENKGKYPKYN